jgi:general secretion pathway protein G
MMTAARTKPSRQAAFTLVELLIVLGILVMIMAFVAPRVLRSGEKADINLTKVQIGGFKRILTDYHLDMKSYPTTEQGLEALFRRPDDLDESKADRWDGPYGDGESAPKDPWGNPYQYEWPSTHGDQMGDTDEGSGREFPDIWSFGPDGEDGTEDDICNWKKETADGEEGDEMPGIDLGGEGDL